MKNKLILFSAMALAALVSCNSLEQKLLVTKVFFDEKELNIELPEQNYLNIDINSKLSSVPDADGLITYAIGDENDVINYNAKHGTDAVFIGEEFASFNTTETSIKKGSVYSDNVQIQLSNLDRIERGKVYVLPLRIQSSSVPIMKGADVKYLIIKAPVKITKVWSLTSNHIFVPIPVAYQFTSVTYLSFASKD